MAIHLAIEKMFELRPRNMVQYIYSKAAILDVTNSKEYFSHVVLQWPALLQQPTSPVTNIVVQ